MILFFLKRHTERGRQERSSAGSLPPMSGLEAGYQKFNSGLLVKGRNESHRTSCHYLIPGVRISRKDNHAQALPHGTQVSNTGQVSAPKAVIFFFKNTRPQFLFTAHKEPLHFPGKSLQLYTVRRSLPHLSIPGKQLRTRKFNTKRDLGL